MYISINQNTKTAYVVENNGDIAVIDLSDNTVTAEITGNYATKPAINPTTNYIYVYNSDTSEIDVIDSSSNSVINTIPITPSSSSNDSGHSTVTDPVENKIYVSTCSANTGTLYIIDGITNNILNTITLPVNVCVINMAINPNTHRLYVMQPNSDSGTTTATAYVLTTIDTTTDQIINEQELPQAANVANSTLTVDSINNEVFLTEGDDNTGNILIIDNDGNLITRSYNYTSPVDMLNSASNPSTGNVYTLNLLGLNIYNKYGFPIQTIPVPCSGDIDVTNI
jgi:DNA-binding beta-propeller fold protein YncE